MDQQSSEEAKSKISRCKARHLRRKRLTIARRAAENNLLLNIPKDSNNEDNRKENDGRTDIEENIARVLTKSKSRRLRKKQKSGLIDNSDQTSNSVSNLADSGCLLVNDNQAINLESTEKYDQNFCDLRLNVAESFDNVLSVLSVQAEQIFSQNLKNDSGDRNLTDKKLPTIQSLNSDEQICETSENSFNSDVNNKFSFQYASTFERKNNEGSLNWIFNPKSCYKLISNVEVIDTGPTLFERNIKNIETVTEITNSKDASTSNSNVSENEMKCKNKKKNERRNKSKSCGKKSDKVESEWNQALQSSDNKLNNKLNNVKLSSVFDNSNEDVTLSSERVSKTVSNTVKVSPVKQELIENQKDIEIADSSEPFSPTVRISPVNIELDCIVTSLTRDSNSDFTINNDLDLCQLEEQRTTIDSVTCSTTDAVSITDHIAPENKPKISNNKVEISDSRETSSKTDVIANTCSKNINSSDTVKLSKVRMNSEEKSREQIKSERDARKAAKAASKTKIQGTKSEIKKVKENLKETPSTNAINSEKIKKDVPSNKAKEDSVPAVNQTLVCELRRVSITEAKVDSPETNVEEKSKAELRAERRAKQEAQRAAKDRLLTEKNKTKSAVPAKTEPSSKPDNVVKKVTKKPIVSEDPHQVNLFKHLYHERQQSLINDPMLNTNIHPAIVKLGVQYASKVIVGSNARCVALLVAVKQFIRDFERPSQADFTRGLEASLQECGAYLHHCRPMAVSMQNALRHLKWQMSQLPATISDNDAKSALGNSIDTYILEQIQLAGKAISITIQTKISNGDVILTYGYSSLIHKILCDAHAAGKQFRVVVVDGRPWLEGKEQLRRLAKHGIECSYILINALSFIMPQVSKVFLGAHAILANGAVMSRAGTAQVALMAKAFNVPVLVACETHKSCERVQTDSIVYNEIGNADELVRNLPGSMKKPVLINWRARKSLNLLNITYDVTPADLVSAVVTEIAILPCTSVPVILRIKPSEI